MSVKSRTLPAELLSVNNSRDQTAIADGRQRLDVRVSEAQYALRTTLEKGYDHWIVTYSGGKDSTAVVCLVFEFLKTTVIRPRRVDIVYCDTKMEIPTLRTSALRFLKFVRREARKLGLPFRCHVLTPTVKKGFWFLLLGKGYPPPHQRFRWCTRRLKIEPAQSLIRKSGVLGKTCVITGVRFRESKNRDRSLYATCRRGGECGQGLWFWRQKKLNVSYLAPIVNWRECDVWDFLLLIMADRGWPTRDLFGLYQKGEHLRFGCWMCTVVRQDRTMARLTEDPANVNMAPLLELRNKVQESTSASGHPESRIRRRDGAPGRLTMKVRKSLYKELLDVQRRTGLELITREECNAIRSFWRSASRSVLAGR